MDQIVGFIDQILHLTDSTAVNLAILAALCLIVFAVDKKSRSPPHSHRDRVGRGSGCAGYADWACSLAVARAATRSGRNPDHRSVSVSTTGIC